jgi:poly(hydroxyalkanoate) granule-associated protein
VITKMPAPMMAPTPRLTRLVALSVRFSSDRCASAWISEIGFRISNRAIPVNGGFAIEYLSPQPDAALCTCPRTNERDASGIFAKCNASTVRIAAYQAASHAFLRQSASRMTFLKAAANQITSGDGPGSLPPPPPDPGPAPILGDMTMTKIKAEAAAPVETVKATAEQGVEIARKIWLAGVGAYGRVFQEAQGQFEKVSGAANEMFDELVAKGEAVEDQVRATIAGNESAQKVTATITKTTEQVRDYREKRLTDLEERFEAVRHAVMEKVNPILDKVAPVNIFAMNDQISALSAQVAELREELAAVKAAKAPVAKAKKTEEA